MLKRFDKNLLLVITGLLLGAGLGFVILSLVTGGGKFPILGGEVKQSLKIGGAAPDFTLKNLAGESIRLKDFAGKPVVINFWATWCGPCKIEMPIIESAHRSYASDVVFLAVNDDEPVEVVKPYVSDLGLTFQVVLDPGGIITDLYRVQGFPTSYFLDAEGIVRAVHVGSLSEKQLEKYLRIFGVGK